MTDREALAALLWEEMRFIKGATDERIAGLTDRLIAAGVSLRSEPDEGLRTRIEALPSYYEDGANGPVQMVVRDAVLAALATPEDSRRLPRCEHGAIREPCIPCREGLLRELEDELWGLGNSRPDTLVRVEEAVVAIRSRAALESQEEPR